MWCTSFQFCPSCNTSWNLNFQIYSPFDHSSALEFQFFALCPSFKWLQTHLFVRVEYRPALWTTFAILNSAPLNYTGLKFENLDGCESRGSLSLIRFFDIRHKPLESKHRHSIFASFINSRLLPSPYLFDDPTFQRQLFTLIPL